MSTPWLFYTPEYKLGFLCAVNEIVAISPTMQPARRAGSGPSLCAAGRNEPGSLDVYRRCTTIHRVCVEGEQLVLHGPNANAEVNATYGVLRKARDSLDGLRYLHAERHSTIMHAHEATSPYSYVPLAVSVSPSKPSRYDHCSRFRLSSAESGRFVARASRRFVL